MTKVYITESGYKLNVASTLRMTASEAETLLDGVFEPVLGNPGTNGYVLSSTTAGVRSWVAQSGGGGASDVGDLTTTSGSSTNMLRVAAAGGLEYRTTAQVLSDIGAAPTASPTFTGTVTLPTTVASVIKPASDSTTALQLANAAGAAVLTVDTTNNRIGVNKTPGAYAVDVNGYVQATRVYVSDKIYSNSILGYASNSLDFTGADGTSRFILGTTGVFRFVNASNVDIMRMDADGGAGFGISDPVAKVDIAASTTAAASLRIRSGTAPTSPNDGDIWYDGSNLKIRIGATTYNVDVTAV